MKTLLVPLALLLFPAPHDEVRLVFAPADEPALLRTFDAEASYHLAGMSLRFGDEEIEPEGDVPEYRMEFQEHVQVRDQLGPLEDGRPTHLVRHFEELSQESSQSEGGEDTTSAAGSPLEGRSVRFEWNAEDERYDVSSADDQELDDDLAAQLDEDLDLRLLLPKNAVSEGDEWEVDARLYLAFMWPSGLLEWQEKDAKDEEDEDPEEQRTLNRQTIENLEGEGHATLKELREEDGRTVAVIGLRLVIDTSTESEQEITPEAAAEDEEEGELEPFTLKSGTRIHRELEGEVLWDVAGGHALGAELAGEGVRELFRSRSFETPEGPMEMSEVQRLEGTLRYQARIERP